MNWKLLVSLVVLLTLSCSPIYAGKGTAYFITQLTADAQDYDVLIAYPQRDWTTYPPFDADQIYLAYYNSIGIDEIDGDPLVAQLHNAVGQYLLESGGTPILYDDGGGYTQYLFRYDDPTGLAYAHANYIEEHQSEWPGTYLDNCFTNAGFWNHFAVDSIIKYDGGTQSTVTTAFGLYRDAFLERLRQITNDRYLLVANTGYPPLYDSNLSGITVEDVHVPTQAKRDEVDAVFRQYIFPGSGFHNISWEWYTVGATSFYAHDGELSYTP